MKTKIILYIISIVILCMSCDPKAEDKDGKILRDSKGNIYIIEHHFGVNYTIDRIDTTHIIDMNNMMNK